ncbi:hypothetical protein TRVL_03282 [Trypanosoma vivax]|nr:hypothetical protein TRVL_03282 [Trypanosoma vivax]
MNYKLLLAEGLNIVSRTETSEREADSNQVRISSSGQNRHQLPQLHFDYERVGRDYILAAEMINYVRRCVIASDEAGDKKSGLLDFCEKKITACMDRCEAVRKKRDSILLPLSHMSGVVTVGDAEVEKTIFEVSGLQCPLRKKGAFVRRETLTDGTYMLVVKNTDAYSVAAPQVTVTVDIQPEKWKREHVEKDIPSLCGWKYTIGVVSSAKVEIVVKTDAVVRDSHIDICLYRLAPLNQVAYNGTLAGLVAESDSDFRGEPTSKSDDQPMFTKDRGSSVDVTAVLAEGDGLGQVSTIEQAHLNVALHCPLAPVHASSCATVEVNPAGLSCRQRLERLRGAMNAWPTDGIMAVTLPKDDQRILNAVQALPSPSEINDCDET